MALNENTVKGKWREIKGEIQKAWGKLTDDELDKTKGDLKAISGLLQQRYGKAQSSYSKKVASIFARFDQKKDRTIEGMKKNLKQ
ncbi:MAG: CsbD family protein [Bdellovibrio sp.]|nr:CsbD family protein [Bdellovibrio sp.]